MNTSSLSLVDDNIFITYEHCPCTSRWCGECCDGELAGDIIDLNPLLHSIAVAAGLTRAFRLGDYFRWDAEAFEDRRPGSWSPNSEGKSI